MALAEEGWAGLSQATIDEWVDQIPEILQKIVEAEGKMSAYYFWPFFSTKTGGGCGFLYCCAIFECQ